MTTKNKTHLETILDALSKASNGDYSTRLDPDPGAPLAPLATAVHQALSKTQRRIASLTQFIEDQTLDARRYRHMLDGMEESYYEVDLQGNLLFFNDTAVRDTGYTEAELEGISFKRLMDATNSAKVYAVFHDVFLTGRPIKGFDWQILKKNGEPIDVESSVAPLRNETGKIMGFRGTIRDVSQRRQAERKYRDILENMEETYLETDLSGNFVFFNDALCRTLGYARSELQGANYRAFSPLPHHDAIYATMHDLFVTGRKKYLHDYELIKKDGSTIYMELSISLLRSSSGEPIGFSGFGRDMTDRVIARRKIEESQRHLKLITDNINDVIWTMDFHFRFTYLSPSVVNLFGFTPEEIMHIPLKAMLPPETYAIIEHTLAEELSKDARRDVPDEDRFKTFEMPLLRKDGSPVQVEISVNFNRDEQGRPYEIIGVTRDISTRKKSEEFARQQEKRYRMMTENVNDIVCVIDFSMRLTYVSESTTRVTGFSVEEFRSMFLEDLLTSESFTIATRVIAEELARETNDPTAGPNRSRSLEIEAYAKDGQNFWLEVIATFNRDASGRATEVLAVGRNITQRRQVEQALAESERRYRLLVENMLDTIWTMDFNFQYTYLSPAIEHLTGYTPEEIRQIPLDRQLTPESMAEVTQVILEHFDPGSPLRPKNPDVRLVLELEVLRKDQTRRWQELTLTFNKDARGNPIEILGVARDISERKRARATIEESEKQYRMIVENMHEAIWTTDLNLKYTYVSPSCRILTGYTAEEIMSLPIDQLLTPESMERALIELASELELESSSAPSDPYRSRTLHQEIYHKNGGTVHLEVTATFVRDDRGMAIGMLMAGRDITARRKAETEKEKLEAQLMQAQKLETVGRLAGGIAHDFNNMLSVILGYVDLVKLKLGRKHPIIKDIVEIEKAAIRSRDITTQLLAFSRKQIIAPRIVDLNELVVNSQKALMRLIGEDVRLSYHPGANLWAIKIDPSQLEQILINLAVNARDAMPLGGTLSITTENVTLDALYTEQHVGAAPGRYIRLSVSDNGTGMDKETLAHIFEPFFTTKETGKGTGLGLATIYGIVSQNQGFINVYSEPGHGTTLAIFLPRTEEVKEGSLDIEDEVPPAGCGNILLVEDDTLVLKIVRGMLESIGYQVLTTQNPIEALAMFQQNEEKIDLVITDVIMPSISGKELRDRLVAMNPNVRVLFMSGYTSDVIVQHGVLEDGVQFLQKPFTLKDLARKVRSLMSGPVAP